MEYQLIYYTRTYVVVFEVTTSDVKASIYNKDVPYDQDWILKAEDTLEVDAQRTDFQVCRALLKHMRKENNI
jgi:hypothetical protein